MSTAAEPTAPPPAPVEHHDESMQNGTDVDDAATSSALNQGEERIERDVSSILRELNQQQLESIVAAARESEARAARRAQGNAEDGDEEDLDGSEAHLSGLGQAASALTSIASGFKRTPGTTGDDKDQVDAPPPPGVDYAQGDADDSKELDDADTSAAIAAAKNVTDSATAAAIASLGSLAASAGHHAQASDQPQPSESTPHAAAGHEGSAEFSLSPSPTSRGVKRPRGPELDRQRKDNHKEVERRRRSAISDGIANLSHIVPGCDAKNTNKGAIIHAAVRYIQDLKHNEASNIEKWTLEKLLMDQALGDLNAQLEDLRRENDRLRAEIEQRYDEQGQHEHPDDAQVEHLREAHDVRS